MTLKVQNKVIELYMAASHKLSMIVRCPTYDFFFVNSHPGLNISTDV